MRKILGLLLCLALVSTYGYSQEKNLQNIKQLTFGGDNAEAYFSPHGKKLTMQIAYPRDGVECDQIYTLDLGIENPQRSDLNLVSTGFGRTTCSFFMPDGKHILYASTHDKSKECPETPMFTDGKYLWPIYDSYDIYVADLEGNIVKRLTDSPGYDAEAVVSPDGSKIAFTSTRSGDLEIWIMDIDGSNKRQVTHKLGYDGGAFFSHDGKKLVFRASHPTEEKDIKEYKYYLNKDLVAPTNMEIFTINIDGTGLKQITDLGRANWAPYFHPSDEKIIFCSNHHNTSPSGHDFQLFMIDTSGEHLHQITFKSYFNSFPMFSPDGTKLAFSSNRNPDNPRETDVFLVDWVDTDEAELVEVDNLEKYISYLASDELEGRLTGSDDEQKAAHYIADILKSYDLKPYSGNSYFQDFKYKVRLKPHDSTSVIDWHGTNVLAFLDNNADKTIVLGAHYDHLGRNEHHHSTVMNSEGLIHNGADDNASGTAALIELSRMLSQNKKIEDANFIFAFFSGEEDGLIGSKHMAETLDDHYPNVVAMINMDMVGRLNEKHEMTVGGVGTSPGFSEIVQKNKPAGFNVTEDLSGVGPSDHTSFYLKDIPVLFFFTGTHEDYHKPSDDEYKINYYGLRGIVYYVFRVVNDLAEMEEIPFTKTKVDAGKRAPKYTVTLGIMPNYADNGKGLKIDGVIDGRPADKAGILTGDILLSIGDCKVTEIYSYMECLSHLKSGDQRDAVVLRYGKKITVHITF